MAKVTAAYKKAEQDTTRTAGLESCLQLCIGAKVMLRRNKDVEAGLVNGSLGTVAGLERRTRKGAVEIVQIKVQFGHKVEPICIDRESCTFEVLKGIF